MLEINQLVSVVFSGLSGLVIDDVADEGEWIRSGDNGDRLEEWINTAEQADLPQVHSFIRGLRLYQDAVHAALTSRYHNGGTEGVNTKTKLIKRQMYGRADFRLLRHRILLQ